MWILIESYLIVASVNPACSCWGICWLQLLPPCGWLRSVSLASSPIFSVSLDQITLPQCSIAVPKSTCWKSNSFLFQPKFFPLCFFPNQVKSVFIPSSKLKTSSFPTPDKLQGSIECTSKSAPPFLPSLYLHFHYLLFAFFTNFPGHPLTGLYHFLSVL